MTPPTGPEPTVCLRRWWPLLPLGCASMAALALMAAHDTSWREEPGYFAGSAIAMGVFYLIGLALVRAYVVPRAAVIWILVVGVTLQLLGTGLWHSDDVHRYVIEGQQILAGQNPYTTPPAAPAAMALVPATVSERINHPEMTAIYPPGSLLVEAGVQVVMPGLGGFTVLACAASLAAIALSFLLMLRMGLPHGWILAVAWNPVLPIFASGEAHNDIVMAALLVAALLLASRGRTAAGIVAATLGVLIKPFAAIALPALLAAGGWRRWWLVPITLTAVYAPFLGAGSGLFTSLLAFSGTMHFHGALDPWVRLGVALIVQPEQVELAVRIILLFVLACALAWLWLRRGAAPLPTLTVRMLGILLLCLPTLHPWYFCAIVVLLPFARSWALAVWTASAGIYWLHGMRILAVGDWVETPWVTALAHLPAIVLMLIETFGPQREDREPARLPVIGRFFHA